MIVCFCFLSLSWGWEAVITGEHPYRGDLSNRAARMVRGLDPSVGLVRRLAAGCYKMNGANRLMLRKPYSVIK